MLTRSYSAGMLGVDGFVVTVEASVSNGLPCLTIVGQTSGALDEARHRVRSALDHAGQPVSPRRQVVNLAPADRRKESPGLDLAVACSLLSSHGCIPEKRMAEVMLWGELALDGELRPAAGTLVVADVARRRGFDAVVVPRESAAEAALIPGIDVIPADRLAQVVAWLRGELEIDPAPSTDPSAAPALSELDMADVRGLVVPRLAVEVMVAGGHNLLFHGPPGVGKTMLARRAGALLPSLSREHALEVTKINSVARGHAAGDLVTRPPVRMPHHTVSPAGLLGGGNPPRPGEVSLAHRGLLFLDELPEYPRACIEGLREPLEDGEVTIVRARYAVSFPARFQLMAAMNPCPCGYLDHPERTCVDSPAAVARYQQRVSGPFLDRMDLVVPISPTPAEEVMGAPPGEASDVVRARIALARQVQAARLEGSPWSSNGEVPAAGGALERLMPMTDAAEKLLRVVSKARQLSPRAQHRLRRVARTCADLEGEGGAISDRAVGSAAHLRRLPER